ncbi:MAG: AgmX/PglI C-terminal domain-containing protein [Myxococcota bacterium]
MTLPNRQFHDSNHPGQMTAAMRAGMSALVGRQGPKLLRVGVVQAGRVREERTIRAPGHVSVGTAEHNSFLLGGGAYPTSFRLFERIDDVYHLNFTAEMQGRVALPSGLFELQSLQARAHHVAGGVHRLALTEEARGRVVIGDVTFLFHFVPPSPVLPKAVLPTAVLRGHNGVDWNSTICAAVSFLFHFVLLSAIYSDWLDPVVDDDVSTAGLIDSLKNLPPPPPIEDKFTPEDSPPVRQEAPASETKPNNAPPTKNSRGRERSSAPSPADHAALSKQLAQIDAAIVGALSTSQAATSSVLKRSEVAWGALDTAAASAAGVGVGAEPRPSVGAPVRPGKTTDFRDLGTTKRGPEDQGRMGPVAGPNVVARIAPPSTTGGVVSNAARVVAGMRAGFRACYMRGLAEDPDASGSIKLTIRVGPGGEVSGVTAIPSGNLPTTVINCVQARAQAAQFDAPEGGSAVISVPVTFVKQ